MPFDLEQIHLIGQLRTQVNRLQDENADLKKELRILQAEAVGFRQQAELARIEMTKLIVSKADLQSELNGKIMQLKYEILAWESWHVSHGRENDDLCVELAEMEDDLEVERAVSAEWLKRLEAVSHIADKSIWHLQEGPTKASHYFQTAAWVEALEYEDVDDVVMEDFLSVTKDYVDMNRCAQLAHDLKTSQNERLRLEKTLEDYALRLGKEQLRVDVAVKVAAETIAWLQEHDKTFAVGFFDEFQSFSDEFIEGFKMTAFDVDDFVNHANDGNYSHVGYSVYTQEEEDDYQLMEDYGMDMIVPCGDDDCSVASWAVVPPPSQRKPRNWAEVVATKGPSRAKWVYIANGSATEVIGNGLYYGKLDKHGWINEKVVLDEPEEDLEESEGDCCSVITHSYSEDLNDDSSSNDHSSDCVQQVLQAKRSLGYR